MFFFMVFRNSFKQTPDSVKKAHTTRLLRRFEVLSSSRFPQHQGFDEAGDIFDPLDFKTPSH
jgi:hypothetical protein